jgi:hypothetical protein
VRGLGAAAEWAVIVRAPISDRLWRLQAEGAASCTKSGTNIPH